LGEDFLITSDGLLSYLISAAILFFNADPTLLIMGFFLGSRGVLGSTEEI
jgi:hypothetical protein